MWRSVLTLIIIIIHFQKPASSLQCESLFNSGQGEGNDTTIPVQFVPIELDGMEFKDLIRCLASVGQSSSLSQEQANNVWSALKKFYSRIEDIPLECFQSMGNALLGIPVEDFQNITLDNIDIVAAFGKYRGMRREQMVALADALIRDWTEKVPETLSEFDLMAMGQIVCHFNKTDILRIHPDAYRGAAQVIGELRDCSPDVLQAFAQLAVQSKAFGPTSAWTQYDLGIVGNVIDGLPPDESAQIPEQFLKDLKRRKGNAEGKAN